MGMSRMFTVTCDFCYAAVDRGEWSAQLARAAARESGFHLNGTRAICPECWEAGRRWKDSPYAV